MPGIPLPYKLELHSDYIKLILDGEMSPEDHQMARGAAFQKLEETGIPKLLINATQAKPKMSVSDDYKFTTQHPDKQPKGVVTAIVYNQEEEEKYRFIETVMSNRGLKIKIFTNEDEALTWMLEQ